MNNIFTERLQKAMDIRGIKQVELVEKTGISKSAISQYLSGAFVPKQKNTYKLADALNVDPAWLMGKDVDMEKKINFQNIIPFKTKRVPLLGEIAAGEPIYVCEEHSTYMEVGDGLDVDFCLKVKGDSMIDARINDGDIVFIREQPFYNYFKLFLFLVTIGITSLHLHLSNNVGMFFINFGHKKRPGLNLVLVNLFF